jgi:hypothetical protein
MPRNTTLSWRALGICWVALPALVGLTPAQAQKSLPSTLFDSEQPLQFRLEASFGDVRRHASDPEYEPARLVYPRPDGAESAIDLRVRLRGKSRIQACSFPPLRLNFPAKALGGTPFQGENKLKLVTHCNAGDAYEQYLYAEYLVYRVLNLLTDLSLRVRLADVTYFDSKRQKVIDTKPAFLIEDEGHFADRQRLKLLKDEHIERAAYDAGAMRLVEMFEYFIGNTDWSALAGPAGEPCCHNVVPMARKDGVLVPIPYDYDATGLVDPPYAAPSEKLPIRNVRTRLYRGVCYDLTDIQASFEPFQRHRDEIMKLFEDPRLGKSAQSIRRYLDDFYDVLADPERVEKTFRFSCSR